MDLIDQIWIQIAVATPQFKIFTCLALNVIMKIHPSSVLSLVQWSLIILNMDSQIWCYSAAITSCSTYGTVVSH